jgi:hypothetical protein
MPVAKKNTRYSKKKASKSKPRYSKKKANKTKRRNIKKVQKGGIFELFGKSKPKPKLVVLTDDNKEEIVNLLKSIYIYYWDEILNKNIFFHVDYESTKYSNLISCKFKGIDYFSNALEPYMNNIPLYSYYEKIRSSNEKIQRSNKNIPVTTIKKNIAENIKILFEMLYEPNMQIIIDNINHKNKTINYNEIMSLTNRTINYEKIIETINSKKKNPYNNYNNYTEITKENIDGIIQNILINIIQIIKILENKKFDEYSEEQPYLSSILMLKHDCITSWQKLGIDRRIFYYYGPKNEFND